MHIRFWKGKFTHEKNASTKPTRSAGTEAWCSRRIKHRSLSVLKEARLSRLFSISRRRRAISVPLTRAYQRISCPGRLAAVDQSPSTRKCEAMEYREAEAREMLSFSYQLRGFPEEDAAPFVGRRGTPCRASTFVTSESNSSPTKPRSFCSPRPKGYLDFPQGFRPY